MAIFGAGCSIAEAMLGYLEYRAGGPGSRAKAMRNPPPALANGCAARVAIPCRVSVHSVPGAIPKPLGGTAGLDAHPGYVVVVRHGCGGGGLHVSARGK